MVGVPHRVLGVLRRVVGVPPFTPLHNPSACPWISARQPIVDRPPHISCQAKKEEPVAELDELLHPKKKRKK